MTEAQESILRIGDGRDWHFVNGEWVDGADGQLSVPTDLIRSDGYGMQGHHYAFYRDSAYGDVAVRFEFMLKGHSDLGVILRATDESHFYLLHFPCCGQARRAQHFWAALSKMDESGYLRCVKLEMVRRVPSTIGYWVPVELNLMADRFTVRIGEHGCFEAQDSTYAGPGQVGVYLNSYYDSGFGIRNVIVGGVPEQSPGWRDDVRQPTNWFHPAPGSEDVWQWPVSLVRLDDGELLLTFGTQGEQGEPKETDERAKPTLYSARSIDGGRSWSEPERDSIAVGVGAAGAHLTPAGRLIRLFESEGRWLISESPDRGRTWSQPACAAVPPAPNGIKKLYSGPQTFLNLADGAMILFLYAGREMEPGLEMFNWGAQHWQAFSCRSTDDGRSWSPLVNMDNSARIPEDQLCDNLDVTETCAAQMSDGTIMALIRPMYSPWMWETWSKDGGVSWGPCVRGPFPGYATPDMLRTSSGAVLVAHRLPTMSINCSLDEGHTWDNGVMIDNAMWCMGAMCEVEPDLVLYCYMDTYEGLMRAQFIRVTPSGLRPVWRP